MAHPVKDTGKTTYTTRQIKLAAEKYGSDEIMVASFTKAAASELAGRDLPLRKEQIGTLHAHCYRALGMPTIAETLVKEWNEEAPQFALTAGGSINPDDPAVDQTFQTDADRIFMEYQVLRAKQMPRELWRSDIRAFGDRWDVFKQEANALDFTDMIETALNDVEVAPGAPSIGFFDEVQDFTPLELALVRKWKNHMDLVMLAGDDDQAIYHFKGANPDAFLNPPIPDEHKRVLSQSYRIPRAVQEVAMKWVTKISKREPKDYRPRDEEGLVRKGAPGNWKNVEPLLEDARAYLDEGKTVMFLATCSYMLEPMKAILRKSGIPFHNPFRTTRGDWNPLGGGGGRGTSSAQRLLAFLRMDQEVWGDQTRMWTPNDIRRWTDVLKTKGVLKKGGRGIVEALDDTDDYPISDEMLLTILEDEAIGDAFTMNLEWFEKNLLAAKKGGMEFPLQIARKFGAQALTKKPQIILGTIHSVKGGQADVVYLFPDVSTNGIREWTGAIDQRDSVIRQFYVGMTRAKETLVLCNQATPYYINLLQ